MGWDSDEPCPSRWGSARFQRERVPLQVVCKCCNRPPKEGETYGYRGDGWKNPHEWVNAPICTECWKKEMVIEMYVGWLDGTWTKVNVEIPSNLPGSELETNAKSALSMKLGREGNGESVVFTGLFHRPHEIDKR